MARAHCLSFMISEVIGGSFCTRMSSTHEMVATIPLSCIIIVAQAISLLLLVHNLQGLWEQGQGQRKRIYRRTKW